MPSRANPRVARSRSRRSADTKFSILSAAERVFAQSGLEGARTESIAAAAGVNKAMLHYYFKSKDLLFLAVLEDNFKEFHRRAMDVLSSGGSPKAVLLRFVETHFDFISSRRDYPRLFQRLMLTSATRVERLAGKYFLPVAHALFEVIERGKSEGEFREVDSHHAAISVVALNVFYFSAAHVIRLIANVDPYSPANLQRRKEQVLQFIRHGLLMHPEEPEA